MLISSERVKYQGAIYSFPPRDIKRLSPRRATLFAMESEVVDQTSTALRSLVRVFSRARRRFDVFPLRSWSQSSMMIDPRSPRYV